MKDIDIFLNKLYKLIEGLENLGREFSDLYRQYDGNEFEEQNSLSADKLDNLILATTHEMATAIGFMGTDIKMLTDFIDFRRTYKEFADNELQEIIDNEQPLPTFKLYLAEKLTNGDKKALLDKIEIVKNAWNKLFGNKNYQGIKKNTKIGKQQRLNEKSSIILSVRRTCKIPKG